MPPPYLQFISHLPLQPSGGGYYAVTWEINKQLQNHFRVARFLQVNPRLSRFEDLWSKFVRRIARRPGTFYPFSAGALRRFDRELHRCLTPDANAIFFRSGTRWSGYSGRLPYFVHTDVVFHTFYENTFGAQEFDRRDLNRIWQREKLFLERARAVFFESAWGLEKAMNAYDLNGDHFFVANNGGVICPPAADMRGSGPIRILTIAKHFETKGGDIVVEAFPQIRSAFPDAVWHIIGGPPPCPLNALPQNVVYEGFLRPDNPDEVSRFTTLLSQADLILHPTREDTNPLVLVEAAYFGCPAVSVRDFAIPELVVDGSTGVLLDRPIEPTQLADAVTNLLRDQDRYLQMRKAARERAIAKFNWNATGEIIKNVILEKLS